MENNGGDMQQTFGICSGLERLLSFYKTPGLKEDDDYLLIVIYK